MKPSKMVRCSTSFKLIVKYRFWTWYYYKALKSCFLRAHSCEGLRPLRNIFSYVVVPSPNFIFQYLNIRYEDLTWRYLVLQKQFEQSNWIKPIITIIEKAKGKHPPPQKKNNNNYTKYLDKILSEARYGYSHPERTVNPSVLTLSWPS